MHNIKVGILYKNGGGYTGEVELGVEDNHKKNSNPKKLQGVNYQNEGVIKKYKPGKLIQARGSYQDTNLGGEGVRYKLEVQDPSSGDWKKIFDHIDYGDGNHKIKNYRGSSAVGSAVRTDGNVPEFSKSDADKLKPLTGKKITSKKNSEQEELLAKLGQGRMSFEKIKEDDEQEEPLSRGKKD